MLFDELKFTKSITGGAWDSLNYGNTSNYNRGSAGKVFVSTEDRDILKRLAEKVSQDLAYKILRILKIAPPKNITPAEELSL